MKQGLSAADIVKVQVAPEAMLRLLFFTALAPGEIGGLGTVRWQQDSVLVAEIMLFPQWVSSLSTELDPRAVGEFFSDMLLRGADAAEVALWWHSHGREPVFWSDEDVHTIEQIAIQPWVSLVINRSGEMLVRLDSLEQNLHRERLHLQVTADGPTLSPVDVFKRCTDEYHACVRRKEG